MLETSKNAKIMSEKFNFFPATAAPQISSAAAAAVAETLVEYADRLLHFDRNLLNFVLGLWGVFFVPAAHWDCCPRSVLFLLRFFLVQSSSFCFITPISEYFSNKILFNFFVLDIYHYFWYGKEATRIDNERLETMLKEMKHIRVNISLTLLDLHGNDDKKMPEINMRTLDEDRCKYCIDILIIHLDIFV